jgi:hypothetical protein
VAVGKPILFEATIFKVLAEEGRWDEQPILEAINARYFTLVVLTHPLDKPSKVTRLTTAVRDALAAAYAPAGENDGYWLYRPLAATKPPSEVPPSAAPNLYPEPRGESRTPTMSEWHCC